MKLLSKAYIILYSLCLFGCKKYLGAKPDKSLETPTTVAALQGILDYFYYMNQQCEQSSEIASDNYYLTDSLFNALPADRMRNAYLWEEHIFNGTHPDDWQNEYTVVYNANVVLDNLPLIQRDETNAKDWDNCKGQALVFRAKSFLEIAQVWSKAYDSVTANTDLGIPLRLTSDYNIPTKRSSIKETYNQIITDLKTAIPLLPDNPVFVFRPSKAAAYGLLARTFLIMGNYSLALLYSDSCLQIKNTLLDFNNFSPTKTYPFSTIQYSNSEDILHSTTTGGVNYNLIKSYGRIDSALYKSYDTNDLRKSLFFKQNSDGSYYFTGNYNGTSSSSCFNGLAVDEIYLIRAESEIRLDNIESATEDMNYLLENRWKSGTFKPLVFTNVQDALSIILSERRKELVYRSLRFSDIKRLNITGAGIVLKRSINGQTYSLEPNDNKYALPIPDNVIQISGIVQN